MPAPSLKHYVGQSSAVSTFFTVVPAVPASRALVVSKLIVTNNGGAGSASLSVVIVVGNTSASQQIANAVTVAPGEVYTETGLVVLAGETVQVLSTTGGATQVTVAVFGQEVDN